MSAAPAAGVPLADHTTLRLGGPAARFVPAATTDELIAAVAGADAAGERLLVLGGGSNLVVSDDGFDGTVVRVDTGAVRTGAGAAEGTVRLRADAGLEWDRFVERCVAEGYSGVECLSGIPGRVGATPIQNVGAYGQSVSETIAEVVVFDRERGERRAMAPAECGFAYRDSVFKGSDRYVVCEVVFELEESGLSAPVAYAELARRLGVGQGERVPAADARATVLELRRGKGMVLDPDDPDTRSAGSFFTNPILTEAEFEELRKRAADHLGPDAEPPAFPESGGRVKTSAAWLIDKAGFTKGYGTGPARISGKHTLALTNPGGATTRDLLALAREVRAGVADRFGVTLVNEPVMVGVEL
ncbi:UDP-N-acetylmuramate dehydrogenase [Nocardiopsis sp. RSe5-2]|uniref:UDP-N-acetylenolpyruvoylglucosamine reductase n=1 Tax=Nocardiopsis endophytica TaxID=3018445 RepID=A0ABT4UB81_9ACTN|nr:UDP-N-acetylmuramate dehydrogenase [Nocardiopsis endophytica]MDA2813582.1 UDP-N-acetylmuramate dehydrogenase [Nocardiopsis endophytica]